MIRRRLASEAEKESCWFVEGTSDSYWWEMVVLIIAAAATVSTQAAKMSHSHQHQQNFGRYPFDSTTFSYYTPKLDQQKLAQ